MREEWGTCLCGWVGGWVQARVGAGWMVLDWIGLDGWICWYLHDERWVGITHAGQHV